MTLTFADLPMTIGTSQPAPSMACANEACPEFAVLYSAESGDYFWANPSDIITCTGCLGPMKLARAYEGVEFL